MFSNVPSPRALALCALSFGLTTAFPAGLADMLQSGSVPNVPSCLSADLPADCPMAALAKRATTTSSTKASTSTKASSTSSTTKAASVSMSATAKAGTSTVSASATVAASVSTSVSVSATSTAVPFNATLQYVSNTGAHAFVAPGSGDHRGPCPGLNAMANHNYMPHSGVGSLTDFINGCQNVFGMGADLATFLAIYGAVFDGNLTSYSIGGPVTAASASVAVAATSTTLLSSSATLLASATTTLTQTLTSTSAGLLVTAGGLSESHNKYEGDSSPVRGDLYQYGNNNLVLSQFSALYALGQSNNNSIDMGVLTNFRSQRFNQSIANNPDFYNGPFTGVVVQPAAYSFIYRFMANKSSTYPSGLLTGSTLMSFYAITGSYGSFTYTPGYEAIPSNWYKRHPSNNYTIAALVLDQQAMANTNSEFLAVGGNTGSTNTFTGVDPSNLTGGAYNAATLANGNQSFCFGVEFVLQQAPSLLSSLYSDVTAAVNELSSAVGNATAGMNCPSISSANTTALYQFPGYKALNSTGMYSNTNSLQG